MVGRLKPEPKEGTKVEPEPKINNLGSVFKFVFPRPPTFHQCMMGPGFDYSRGKILIFNF